MSVTTLPKSSESLSVSMDSWLIQLLDQYAERNMSKRSAIIREATLLYLLVQNNTPDFWRRYYQERMEESC